MVLTNDTAISATDQTYEGQDLVVSNAVLTVDGPHTFNGLRLAAGATLTHSPNGSVIFLAAITNEPVLLTDTNAVPLANFDVVLGSVVVTATNGLVTYTNEVDFSLANLGSVLTIQRTTNSLIADGDTVFIAYNFQTTAGSGLRVTLTADFELEPGASVDVNGRGFGGDKPGPGAGWTGGSPSSGGGGGYGGFGGLSSSNAPGGAAYGSPIFADSLGSAGGPGTGGFGGRGGGKIQLSAGGRCILNGHVSADGQNATNNRAGGGSGGGVFISALTISGTGTLSARGGAGEPVHGGGGGGGRIALTAETNEFAGAVVLAGGAGGQCGGAGTLFATTNSLPGKITIDNGGFAGANTPVDLGSPARSLEIAGRATVVLPSSSTQQLRDLLVRSNCSLTTSVTNNATLYVNAVGNVVVESGAVVSLDGRGYPANQGTGVGQSGSVGSGAGHGGYGGYGIGTNGSAAGGNYYGSIIAPATLGSGGRTYSIYPGGAGGGAVRFTVAGNLQLDGRISVDGTAGAGSMGGGASGGSLWLTAGQFSGSGLITANGGLGGLPYGGGGAGGRIAINFNSNSFGGKISATGGAGAVAGGAGTIYTKLNSSQYANLRVDNGGLAGTNTVLDSAISCNLAVTGATALRSTVTSALTFGSVDVASNSSLTLGSTASSVQITVASNLTIAAGGTITSDRLGWPSGAGNGYGQSATTGSGGAGNGGFGGRGLGATGGFAYGNSGNPGGPGSGGGGINQSGGVGGGGLYINCLGVLRVDGRLTANGASSVTNNGGGGSGGTLGLTLKGLAGSGVIAADGGNGHLPNGGGGGGGRITVGYTSNSFTGVFSAKGGSGFVGGGAGTIYLKAGSSLYPDLVVDSGANSPTNSGTLFDLSSVSNLTIGAGSTLTSSVSSLTIHGNLDIRSNATWRCGSLALTALGAVSIAAGGGLSADGASVSSLGAGLTGSGGSGGGGHGGYGGRGAGTTGGGNAYDLATSPVQPGSPGGEYSTAGGYGGGALRMTVSGPVTLEGTISANGANASTNISLNARGGGGSGGGILLTLNQFSGTGRILADGGNGWLNLGGGGGGGRIAVFWNSNSFTGKISAKGGTGFQGGGAGTIYLARRSGQILPSLIVDNGGLSGTNTLLSSRDTGNGLSLTIAGGAVLRAESSSTMTMSSLTVATNSTLLSPFGGSALNLSLTGPVLVEAGGSISADGLGFTGGAGTSGGAGVTATGGSGGGGHAGFGGRGLGNAPVGGPGTGGNAYDLLSNPTLAGSGGGGMNFSGGSGGGVIQITANGPFTLNGRISANGVNATTNNAGGGAGGTIKLIVTQLPLLGSGVITADGGSGHLPNGGGGGGGGRITLSYPFAQKGNQITNGFTGSLSAKGGGGFVRGGAGTVYLRTNNASIAQVFVDNGGGRGTNTFVVGTGSFDLTIQGGAAAVNIGSPRDLLVRSNAWLAEAGNVNIGRNATFDAGGGIDLDGQGNSRSGAGATLAGPKGGGGHGGYGGLNPLQWNTAYDSVSFPIQGGSPGGNGSGTSGAPPYGGNGGGTMQLSVGSTLLVNGRLSANGMNGDFNSGGGSGGAIRLQAATLSGDGVISVVGGDGNGTAGGGGGGRIAIYFTTNLFSGTLSACGGSGALAGGAGTIYLRDNSQLTSLLLDNCGRLGANTPLSTSFGLATNISVGSGAIAEFQGAIPAISNLVLNSGGWATARSSDTNLYLALLGNLSVSTNAGISLDAKGAARAGGTGAGTTLNQQGAGGSYGGFGGNAASGAFSGPSYGSATMPVDRGSGGGNGSGPATGGSEGGGAVHLAVAGTLALDGLISAGGNWGWQDDSGGGSGGSVWISAKRITGAGTVTAEGGFGDFYGGGGGGGGRIAIYSPTNQFTGTVSVAGGEGAFPGDAGTVFTAASLTGFDVVSQTPSGLVSNAVSLITLEFNEAINPLSVTTDDLALFTPYGLLDASNLSLALPAPATLRISFPPQNVPGDYRLEIGPAIEGFLASRMSQSFTGAFTAVLPLLNGTVTDTNGQPVAGVVMQPDGGLMPVTTDTNGNYSLAVPYGWIGGVTPALGNFMFAPGSRGYVGVTNDRADQNFLMVATLAAQLGIGSSDTNLLLSWNGIADVTYQVYWTTNLESATWYPLDVPIAGTNGPMQLLLPITDEPEKYFRLDTHN